MSANEERLLQNIDLNRNSRFCHAAFLGLVITLSQIVFACLLSDAKHPIEAYLKLCMWDSGWYQHIIEQGYRSVIPPVGQNPDLSNVAFLPGYPLVAGAIAKIFRLPTPHALLLAAQLACWFFWTYVFLFFQRWQVSTRLALAGAIAILVHPAAFYLVVGYSESLFLMALLGFLYWTTSARRYSWLLAAVHGFVMTATRIVGLPLAIYPILHFWLFGIRKSSRLWQQFRWQRFRWQQFSKYLAISAFSTLGCILFFAFCYFKFGSWNIYMKTQAIGWGVKPDYLAILQPKSYFNFLNYSDFISFLNGVSVTITMACFIVLAFIEWTARFSQQSSWRSRIGFYFCGWFMFYLSVSGLSYINMNSMIRYTFCSHIMLTLAGIHILSTISLARVDKRWIFYLLLLVAACSFVIQNKLVIMFTSNRWVA